MRIEEARQTLSNAGYVCEDTDDWDEADMPAGLTPLRRKQTADRHHYGTGKNAVRDRSLRTKMTVSESFAFKNLV